MCHSTQPPWPTLIFFLSCVGGLLAAGIHVNPPLNHAGCVIMLFTVFLLLLLFPFYDWQCRGHPHLPCARGDNLHPWAHCLGTWSATICCAWHTISHGAQGPVQCQHMHDCVGCQGPERSRGCTGCATFEQLAVLATFHPANGRCVWRRGERRRWANEGQGRGRLQTYFATKKWKTGIKTELIQKAENESGIYNFGYRQPKKVR